MRKYFCEIIKKYAFHQVRSTHCLPLTFYQNLCPQLINLTVLVQNSWSKCTIFELTSSKRGRFPATVVSSSTLFLCFSDNGARGESFTSHRLSFSFISLEYDKYPAWAWAAMLALRPKCIKVFITRLHLLQVSCFPSKNKMAAELSILASSFLETKPESYTAFFLECIESKQHLNLEVSKITALFKILRSNSSWYVCFH